MGGGKKNKRNEAAIKTSADAAELERKKAATLNTQLEERRKIFNPGLQGDVDKARDAATDIANTGGFRKEDIDIDSRGYGGYKDLSNKKFDSVGYDKKTELAPSLYDKTTKDQPSLYKSFDKGPTDGGGYKDIIANSNRKTGYQDVMDNPYGSNYKNMGVTGGYDPNANLEELQKTGGYTSNERLKDLADTGFFKEVDEYGDLARTGGFNPGEKEQFLRRSTAPVAAMYARTKDEMARKGGGGGDFTASNARLLRQGAQTGAEASLGGNVELSKMIREGKLQGMQGIERGRIATQQGRITGTEGISRENEAVQRGRLDATALSSREREAIQKGKFDTAAGLAGEQELDLKRRLEGLGGLERDSEFNLKAKLEGLGGLDRQRESDRATELEGLKGQERERESGYGRESDRLAGLEREKIFNRDTEAGRLGGLEREREFESGQNLEGLKGMERTREAGGNEAANIAAGRRAGADLLQRFNQMGISALNDTDITDLRSRLQSGQMSQADSELLAQIASRDKSTFDKIMQGIQVGGGAIAGIMGAR